MPTVLLVTYHFPPSAASGSFRMLGFAQHLPAHGWKVVVVAPPSLPWEPVDPALAARVPAKTIVCPAPYPAHLPKALRWLMPYNVWLPYARAMACKAIAEYHPDVLLTSGPPHALHMVGRHLQKHLGVPWVADFRDPWVQSNTILQVRGVQRIIEGYWERRVMRTADLILANAPNACAALQRAFPESEGRMRYLTNGFDPADFPESKPWQPHAGPYHILHAGQLYAGRDPRPLLDALVGQPGNGEPDIHLDFLGRTEYAPGADLLDEARQRGVEARVHCLGQVKYHETLTRMGEADVLLLMDTPGRTIGVPAKLYEYFGANRPILATGEPNGDLAAVLQRSGVPHRIVPPGEPGHIRQGMVELVNGLAQGTLANSPSDRLRFSRHALAGELADMLAEVARRRA